jgi:hypothetical protein
MRIHMTRPHAEALKPRPKKNDIRLNIALMIAHLRRSYTFSDFVNYFSTISFIKSNIEVCHQLNSADAANAFCGVNQLN